MIDIEKNKKKFIRIATENISCKNLNKLLAWLDCESDFYEAPASARHHLAEPGGLCLHSLNVYKRLHKLLHDEYEGVTNSPYNETSIAIVALFHDLCKANMYKPSCRNQKTYDPEKVAAAEKWTVKHDAGGDFIWETVQAYEIDEKLIFGHGEKSVFILQQFMSLSVDEATAIRYHMSSWQEGEARAAGDTFRRNPLAFFLHVADEAATFIDEVEKK
jgi:hypothetical protein